MSRIYALANQKGGVGKTTSAINLGAYLGTFGQRVLLVDIDPQANATSCLGIEKRKVDRGAYEALVEDIPASTTILHNAKIGVSILPASPALAGAEVELVELEHREMRLKRILQAVRDRYDYILIDCPPSLGLLTVNGLVAAEGGVIIPVQCEYLALEGLGQLSETIHRVKASLFPGLNIRGVILTMFDARTRLANDVVAEVRRVFPNQVFRSVIPRSIRLAEAPSYGLPVSLYAPESQAAKAYSDLAQEILAADGVPVPAPQE
jgi:chromosome partitioning protein